MGNKLAPIPGYAPKKDGQKGRDDLEYAEAEQKDAYRSDDGDLIHKISSGILFYFITRELRTDKDFEVRYKEKIKNALEHRAFAFVNRPDRAT